MKKINWKREAFKVFWIFVIGSMVGCLVELMVCFVQEGHLEFRQGLIYGPFIPVYGIGATAYYVALSKVKDWKQAFFISMVLGGFVEYLCSWVQENWFGTVSWDYSHLWFNINGRTSLLHCLYWGVGGILFVKWVIPFINQLDDYCVGNRKIQYLTMFLAVFLVVDIAISCMAAERQKERMENRMPEGKMDQFLDYYYPDQVLDIFFSNKKIIIKQPRKGGNINEMSEVWE